MDIFIGVDGTGPSDDAEYEAEFGRPAADLCAIRQSHVFSLWQGWHSTVKNYTRGPTTTGLTTQNLASNAAREARELYRQNPGARIFLAGYSRGGSAVIQAAYLLMARRIPVHCMMLFDAVDRAVLIVAADVIPPNVAHCYHAVRRPESNSRAYFGNCGLARAPGVNFVAQRFRGTHGALGGLPWPAESVGSRGTINEHGGLVDTAANAMRVGVGLAAGTVVGALTRSPRLGQMAGRLTGGAAENVTRRALYTNITPAEDRAASAAVWQWMNGHLSTARGA